MDETEKKSDTVNPMSGKLFDKNTIFQRSFRFVFEAVDHPDIRWWITKIRADYKNKILDVEAYDDVDGVIFAWLSDIHYDEATRKATTTIYDGCGNALSSVEYHSLEIEEHYMDYDYSKSDVLTHKLKFSYRNCTRRNLSSIVPRGDNLYIH